jgi:hypothetical protein
MTSDDGLDKKIQYWDAVLNEAAQAYMRQENENGEQDHGRTGVRLALHVAMDALEEWGANSSQLMPLNRLMESLNDLEQGTLADLLKPAEAAGQRSPEYEQHLLRALAVAAVDLLMTDNTSLKDATAHVARKLQLHGYQVTKNPNSNAATAIQNWRKNIDLNPAKPRRDNLLKGFEQRSGTATAKAEKLLSQLPGIIPVPSKR